MSGAVRSSKSGHTFFVFDKITTHNCPCIDKILGYFDFQNRFLEKLEFVNLNLSEITTSALIAGFKKTSPRGAERKTTVSPFARRPEGKGVLLIAQNRAKLLPKIWRNFR